MATVILYNAGNMFTSAVWYGYVTSYSSSQLSLSAYPYAGTYYGIGLTYDSTGVTGGTLTGYMQSYYGALDYTVTGANADAHTAYQYVQSGDAVGVEAYVLQGNDNIQGSPYNDAIRGWSGNDTIHGESGDDTILGDDGADLIYGDAGNDVVLLGNGNDIAYGGDGSDIIYGEDGNDSVLGEAGNDQLYGGTGNDNLMGGAGNDYIDGGLGIDTAYFNGLRASYTINGFAGTVSGPDGADALANIERLSFADKKIALDLAPDGGAAYTVEIIGAAYGASNIQAHPDWVGMGLNFFDSGMTIQQVCATVVGLMGPLSNVSFVNTVYQNVVGAPPSDADRGYYIGLLQGSGGTMSQADLLVFAANCDTNVQHINLVGLQQSGVEFI